MGTPLQKTGGLVYSHLESSLTVKVGECFTGDSIRKIFIEVLSIERSTWGNPSDGYFDFRVCIWDANQGDKLFIKYREKDFKYLKPIGKAFKILFGEKNEQSINI